ncbi:MAG: phage integrase SAM-like domain-containing protein [Bacteroidaceae bacterium]|nr:phage integrase SAM-like domain-containing protein [Bacteroidaceae bacterium]
MASIVLRLDERSVKNGMCPVRLRISHQHQSAWVGTGVAVEPQFFRNDSLYDPITNRAYMAKEKRESLAVYVRKWDEGLFDLLHADGGVEQLNQMTAAQLRAYIFGERKKKTAKEVVTRKRGSTSADFLDWFQQYGQTRAAKSTRSHFDYIWRLLYNYMKERGMQALMFQDITYTFLVDLKAWNRKSRGEATRYKCESYIRAAYREGMRRGMVRRELDPFFDYKIERMPLKDIETVGPDTLRRLAAMKCNNSETTRTRDMLLASFYLCGANFQDMYYMPAAKDGQVEFVRSKVSRISQRTVQIRIEPELAAIIERYKDPTGERLFSFGTKFEIMQHNFRRGCDKIEAALGERVNFAKIRRTWATVAGKLECPDEVIDMSLGHVPATVRCRHYEDYDWTRTAKWNRKIIDYTLYNKQS